MNQTFHDLDVLSLLFERSEDGVVVCNSDAEIILFNAAASRIYGAPSSVVLADCPAMFGMYVPDGSRLYRVEELPMSRALAGEEVRGVEILLRPPHRPETRVRVDAYPVRGASGIVGAMIRSRRV